MKRGDEREYPIDNLEILELQIIANGLANEIIQRYVSNPANLPLIREHVQTLYDSLAELQTAGCPDGWDHKRCRCIPPKA